MSPKLPAVTLFSRLYGNDETRSVSNHLTPRQLTEDLLLLAREGDEIGETTPVEIAAVAEQASRAVLLDDASLAIETDQTVMADRSRLEQLLGNLLGNSIEHAHTSTAQQPASTAEDGGSAKRDGSATSPTDIQVTLGELNGGFYR